MGASLEFSLPLAVDFSVDDFLAFHGRDSEQVSERIYTKITEHPENITGNCIDKAILWDEFPACIKLCFTADTVQVSLNVDTDIQRDTWPVRLEKLCRRMLGLDQDLLSFEKHIAGHRELAGLVSKHRGLRVPLSANPFEALCWAVTGQQISVYAAVSIRRRFIQLLGAQHSGGLLCHPDPAAVASSNVEQLRRVGLSLAKANGLIALASAIQQETLNLPTLDDGVIVDETSADTIRGTLLTIRGIGPWTVNYALLRGFGYLDGSLHGDVAVRRNLQLLLGQEQKISASETEQWLAQFSPWRALVAAHLWAMQSDVTD